MLRFRVLLFGLLFRNEIGLRVCGLGGGGN